MEIPSNADGCVDLEALKNAVSHTTAAFMITNPNTLGIFEDQIQEVADIVHDAGALLYYDGANFNAIMGMTSPGKMNFDIMHFNLHKTFATPHGGGGPGAGPVGVREFLEKFLPVPRVIEQGGQVPASTTTGRTASARCARSTATSPCWFVPTLTSSGTGGTASWRYQRPQY